jgi:hypothetical protein
VELQLVQSRKFHLLTPRSSSQDNLTVLAIDGLKKWKQTKPWNNFKIHFAAAYRQHSQMQGETVGAQGYENTDVAQSEDGLAEQALGGFAHLATATDADRGVVAQLTEANSRLAKQLEDNALALKEIKALLEKESMERSGSVTLIVHLAALSCHLLIKIAGTMVTNKHEATHAKIACIPSMDISVRPPRQTTWEAPKPTGIDFWGDILK